MKKNVVIRSVVPLLLSVFIAGCTIISRPKALPPTQSQLQTRQSQTREYDTNNVKLVMKAALNTLQDDGFTIKNAVPDLGLISAVKEIDLGGQSSRNSQSDNDDFWSSIFLSAARRGKVQQTPKQDLRYEKFKQIEATLNISEFGRQTRVRASFQAKVLDDRGSPMEVYPIDDLKFYQDFFMKIDKGVFIEKQKF